jgi:RNA polymerase sigma-70 factor (ECF subfamily)
MGDLAEARQRFLALVAEVRPELHRYCARMTGSVFDGEDVVQDTLAKASFALAELEAPPPLRPWLFRIAHNTAMDFLRRSERRNADAMADLEEVADMVDSPDTRTHGPDGERVELALTVFAALPAVQRSALALKDVLGLSLEETAATMGTSVPAVKGALVRARANVAAASAAGATPAEVVDLERLRTYARLFNARDWDALRALFGEETRLDVVSRYQRQGRSAAQYYTQYGDIAPRRAGSTACRRSRCSARRRAPIPRTSSASPGATAASSGSATSGTCPTSPARPSSPFPTRKEESHERHELHHRLPRRPDAGPGLRRHQGRSRVVVGGRRGRNR